MLSFGFYIPVHIHFAVCTQGLQTNDTILFQFWSLSEYLSKSLHI